MERVALVTGGARRIGAEIARHLHRAGFTLALHYSQSAADAESLVTELCDTRPGSCHAFRADLRRLAEIRAMGEAILHRFGGLDLLVNNASGFSPTPIESCTEAEFDTMIDTNLKGHYFLIQSTLGALRSRQGGIVNILDSHVEQPLRHFNAYVAAKAGLASLTRSLALELGPEVRVNGIAPGAILWPETGEAYDSSTRRDTIDRTPLKRLGEPADIARAVVFLATEAPFISGQVITVDGGRSVAG